MFATADAGWLGQVRSPAALKLRHQPVDLRRSLSNVTKRLQLFQLRIACRIRELFRTEKFSRGRVRVRVGKLIRNQLADFGPENVVDKSMRQPGVLRRGGDGEEI